MKRRWAMSSALALAACSAGMQGPVHRRPPLLAAGATQATYASPATWSYHPRHEAKLGAEVDLGKGRQLYAGGNGERWLVDTQRHTAEAAAELAPETLVSILKLDDGWLFVGQSGTGYEAKDPIGPFVRASSPLDPLARTSAAAQTIVGVRRRDGALVRSADAGASWQEVGPARTRFADVALDSDGNGLAVAVPEALFATRDKGATWTRLDVPSSGVTDVESLPASGIAVLTAFGRKRWSPGASDAFVPITQDAAGRASGKLPVAPARGPDAAAITDGRAAIIDGRYVEISPLPKRASRWELVSGPFAGRLEQRELADLDGCRAVRMAGFGRTIYVACARSGAAAQVQNLVLWRSDDSGKHFKREPYVAKGRLDDLGLAAGQGGALLVTGVCAPQADHGCSPGGVYYRREVAKKKQKGKLIELAPAATPALKDSALALVFSVDGRIAYAVGRRTKNGSLAVFTSHDGGRTFDAHEIDQLPPEYASDDYSDERYGYYYQRNAGALHVVSAEPAEDGALALVLNRYTTTTLVVTDEEGRAVSIAHAPDNSRALAAAGTRALAVSPRSNQAWESLDGGASWEPIGRLPVDACGTAEDCAVPMACSVGGCIIGSELSRIGWRGQADDDQGVLAPPKAALSPIVERKLRAPLSCALDESGWHAIPDMLGAPDAASAALGKVVWFGVAADDEKASAAMVEGFGGAHPRLERLALLPASRRPDAAAFYVSSQIEGMAALRYVTPEASSGATTLREVEIAWVNLFEGGRLMRARIADAGPYVPGDYVRGSGHAQVARPELLSIANGGIFVRVHGQAPDRQPTLFADGRSITSVPRVDMPGSGQDEMAHVGAAYLPLLFTGRGATTIRARRAGSGWVFDAFATGLAHPADFGLNQYSTITYLDGRPARVATLYAPDGDPRSSQVFPLRADGAVFDAPVAVPTQLDYTDRPPRCSATQRSSTPRVVQPFIDGTRHPVIISDANEPLRLLMTGRAVMYGTPKSPCVAALDAEVVPLQMNEGRTQGEHAILPTDDLDHAWLFRTVSEGRGSVVQYRNMSCRYDPTAEVPAEAYSVQGATIRRQ